MLKATKCLAYIQGVSDSLEFFQNLDGAGKVVCLPKGVNIGQLVDIATKHLRENPEKRHYGADSIILGAWLRAFPCGNAK